MRPANRATHAPAIRVPLPDREGPWSFEEYIDVIPDGVKADLLDGVIYMASPDNTDAGELQSWLSYLLIGFVDFHSLGKIYLSRITYRIGPKRGPEPDIGFVSTELEHTRRRGYIDGPPALAIEIVSPDSVQRDYVKKRKIYEEAGVREYWIIDPDANKATFLRLHGKRYRAVKPIKDIFHSDVVPGFSLDVRWLMSAERPSAYAVLQQLLKPSR